MRGNRRRDRRWLRWGWLWACAVLVMGCQSGRPMGERQGQERSQTIVEREGLFGQVYIIEEPGGLRRLRFGRFGADQSVVRLGDPDHLVFTYMKGMISALAYEQAPQRALLVGLGGGSLPMFLRRHLPELPIEVVEVDPVVVELAESHMGFELDEKMKVTLQDALYFFEDTREQWDLIALDAYGPTSIPRHLMTQSFYEQVARALSPEGVVAINIWGPLASPYFYDLLRTIEAAFPKVALVTPAQDQSRVVLATHEGDLSQARLMEGAIALDRTWRLRFDLVEIVERGFQAPGHLPEGGRVILE